MTTILNAETVCRLLPERPVAGHKGTFGHLFVIAGSRGFMGAARLCCEAGMRSGAGLVTLGIPHPLGDVSASLLAEAMTLRLPATETEALAYDALEPALEFVTDKQGVVLGPGLSLHAETIAFVHDFVALCPAPLLVDADGLNALSECQSVLADRKRLCILTPHPGEIARLISSTSEVVQADREGTAARFAETSHCVVVLKGHRSIIAHHDGRIAINPTGNSGLGKGGTGDALSGLIGGLLAQGMDAFDAACLGVYVHGRAGDLVAECKTARGMIVRDVIEAFPEVWRELESK